MSLSFSSLCILAEKKIQNELRVCVLCFVSFRLRGGEFKFDICLRVIFVAMFYSRGFTVNPKQQKKAQLKIRIFIQMKKKNCKQYSHIV